MRGNNIKWFERALDESSSVYAGRDTIACAALLISLPKTSEKEITHKKKGGI